MKFFDLLRMSTSSLWKRKVRTILTILGVMIGTSSIVVMMSLGIGLNELTMASIEESGGLTTITVTPGGGGGWYGDMPMTDSGDGEAEVKYLNDETVDTLSQIEDVESVAPILSMSALAIYGSYQNNMYIEAMPVEALEELGIEFAQGGLPNPDDGIVDLVYGNQVMSNFYNPKSSGFDNSGLDIDLIKEPLFIILDTNAYYQSLGGQSAGEIVKPPKKYPLYASGVVAGEVDDWGQHSYSIYCEIGELKKLLKKEFKNKLIPEQPTMPSGKPYKEIFYSSIKVNVSDMKKIEDIQQTIIDLGYNAYSNMEWIEQSKQQTAIIQAVLGGIGAVSLLVAAIGITNTMMMSIYERTKEIGIIKVLGCDMKNIREQFLLEAGYIGFIGGVAGLILSYIISLVINLLISASGIMGGMGGESMKISSIPMWLALASIAFAVTVGMIAGFFPALRAMKLSPLAAIRNE